MENERDTTSLRQKFRRSSMNLSCCFHGQRYEELDSSEAETTIRCPRRSRNRRHSYDFSYDATNYALNFDQVEPAELAWDDDVQESSFSRRLRNSPATAAVERNCERRRRRRPMRNLETIVEPVSPRPRSVTPPPRTVSREILVETF